MTIHKSHGATFQTVAIGFKSNFTQQYGALSRVTSGANGLYILGECTKPPKDDDPIFQEMKRLKQHSMLSKFSFLHQHNDPNTLQIMYHNVQSLNAHYDDIAADPCTMNSDILLFAETWTIAKDTFQLDQFDHYHLFSDLTERKLGGVSIYVKKKWHYMVEVVKHFPNYDTGVHAMVVSFKTKIRIVVLYAKPGSLEDDILDALEESLNANNNFDYKTVLAGDFNININSPEGKEFCEYMEDTYFLKLRNNPSDSTTIPHTLIDYIFSTNIIRTVGVYESAFGTHLPFYVQIPWEKMKVPTLIPPEDDPRLECGPDLLDRTAYIEWEEEDDDYPL